LSGRTPRPDRHKICPSYARGRRAGIVRRPRRKAEFCFKFGDTRRQRRDLPALFGEGRRLREDHFDQRRFVERFKNLTIHPKLESDRKRNVQINQDRPKKSTLRGA
jgi:hypothetical protein